MKRIDTTYWKEFRIGDLFEKLELPFYKKKFNKAFDVSLEKNEEYSLPLVNAKHSNNGIMYYGRPTDFAAAEMTIDIVADGAASTGDVYPQPQRTGVLYNAYLVKLKDRTKESNAVLFFLSTIIERCIKQKFGYDNKCTWDKVRAEYIMLPTKNDTPDWQYMEEYMCNIERRVQCSISALYDAKYDRAPINTMYWKEFSIDSLFRVVKGKRLTKAHMIAGDINYIGATAFNNGVSAKIGNDKYIHPAGTITVCYNGSIGQTFYQEQPFWASDDVNVLYPKFKISKYIAHFICPIIYKLSLNYAYVDKWTADKMRVAKIKLPATPSGEPDWHYMEMYMRGVEAIVKNKISTFVPHKPEVAIKEATTVNIATYNDYSKTFNVEK